MSAEKIPKEFPRIWGELQRPPGSLRPMSRGTKGLFLAKLINVSVGGRIITDAPWFLPNAVTIRDLTNVVG